MGMFDKILQAGIGSTVESLAGAARQFITTDADEAKLKIEMQRVLQDRAAEQEQTLRAELQMRERIMVAEMEQGDNYTKRARPTITYAGLVMIAFNYVVAPMIGQQPVDLPQEFWYAWAGVVGIYGAGRSYEKASGRSKKIAGSASRLLD